MEFGRDENGAVTVDWVVLTAALVGLGLAVMGATSKGVQDASEDIDGQLTAIQISSSFATAIELAGLDQFDSCGGTNRQSTYDYYIDTEGLTEVQMDVTIGNMLDHMETNANPTYACNFREGAIGYAQVAAEQGILSEGTRVAVIERIEAYDAR